MSFCDGNTEWIFLYSIKSCSSLQWTGNPGKLTQVWHCQTLELSPNVCFLNLSMQDTQSKQEQLAFTVGNILLSRLNCPNSLCLSSEKRCFSPFIIFLALCWTVSSISMSLLYWRAQHWTLILRFVSLVPRREGSPPLTCWWCQLLSKSCSILEGIWCDVSHWLRYVGSFGCLEYCLGV